MPKTSFEIVIRAFDSSEGDTVAVSTWVWHADFDPSRVTNDDREALRVILNDVAWRVSRVIDVIHNRPLDPNRVH